MLLIAVAQTATPPLRARTASGGTGSWEPMMGLRASNSRAVVAQQL